MIDREKVIKALECMKDSNKRCGNPCEETGACNYAYYAVSPDGKPYYPFFCNQEKILNDALELLKKDDQQRDIKWGPPIRIEMGDIDFPEIKYCPWCGRMVKWEVKRDVD